jgi:1-deoxy-D-xylulose-5-phosphate synthase
VQLLTDEGVTTPVRVHGIPQEFLHHARRGNLLEEIGLTPQAIALQVVQDVTALDGGRALMHVD